MLRDYNLEVLLEYIEGYLTRTVFNYQYIAYKVSLDRIGNTLTLGRDREEQIE